METLVEACQRERHAHSKDNQSHRPRRRVVQKAPLARVPPCATSTIMIHITFAATATATSAVTGSASFACATASVITPDGSSERHCNQETNEAEQIAESEQRKYHPHGLQMHISAD